jgi:hypothetical protein
VVFGDAVDRDEVLSRITQPCQAVRGIPGALN